jgi:serine/threonine protein kinase
MESVNGKTGSLSETGLPPDLANEFDIVTFSRKRQDGKGRFTSNLGRGSFGVVKLIRNKSSNEYFACKIMRKADLMKRKMLAAVHREIETMRELGHPRVLSLFGCLETDTHIYMQLELASRGPYNLHHEQFKQMRIPESVAGVWFGQLMEGVEYLHKQGYVHRDIKTENVLLDQQFKIKIGDFGACGACRGRIKLRYTFTGTPEFMPPESISMKGHSFSFDIWSAGVFLFFSCAGFPPFFGKGHERTNGLFHKIKQCTFNMDEAFSPGLKHLIALMLVQDSSKRPSAEQILRHPWVLQSYGKFEDSDTNAPCMDATMWAQDEHQMEREVLGVETPIPDDWANPHVKPSDQEVETHIAEQQNLKKTLMKLSPSQPTQQVQRSGTQDKDISRAHIENLISLRTFASQLYVANRKLDAADGRVNELVYERVMYGRNLNHLNNLIHSLQHRFPSEDLEAATFPEKVNTHGITRTSETRPSGVFRQNFSFREGCTDPASENRSHCGFLPTEEAVYARSWL